MSDGICFNFFLDRDIYSLNTETCLKCRSNLDYLITNPKELPENLENEQHKNTNGIYTNQDVQ